MTDVTATSLTTEANDSEPSTRSAGRWHPTSARLALWAFGAYVVIAFFVILFVLGDDRWFLGDEWTFLSGRDGGNLNDYFEPVNGHWVTLPLLVWKMVFEVVGLHSYVAYQVPVVLLHLTTACLLRVVMRRVGVEPWIATAAAASFVLLGPGENNIVWGFQITLVGSLVAGLAHMLLANHDGPVERRDWIGLALGLVGLLSSGVAIMMVVGVGLAVLLRRGWRSAAFHTVPLAVVYGIWYLAYRPQTVVLSDDVGVGHYVDVGTEFVWLGVSGVFTSIGHYPVVGVALAAMFVVGLAFAWLPLDRVAFARQAGMPLGLLVAGMLLMISTMFTRGFIFGATEARADRYLHLFVALALPALAVAADALARRWRVLVPVVVVLFLVGVPANIDRFEESVYGAPYFESQKRLIFGIGRSELAQEVPRWITPEPSLTPHLTIGWLRDAVANGDVPDARPPDPADASWAVRLGVAHHLEPIPDDMTCKVRSKPLDLTPRKGKRFAIEDGVLITELRNGQPVGPPVSYDPAWSGKVISIEVPDLELRFQPAFGATEFTFCA